jgi:hypothetical protein
VDAPSPEPIILHREAFLPKSLRAYPFVWQPKPHATVARGGSGGQVASLQCILHNMLLSIGIIRMKALPTMPLLTEGHITEYIPSP